MTQDAGPGSPPEPTDPLVLAHQRAREALRRVAETGARLQGIIARTDNRDHTVQISVNPSGSLTELYLTGDCMRLSPEDLGREIMTVYAAAVTRAEQLAEVAFGEHTGLPPDLAQRARRGDIDFRGMLQWMGQATPFDSPAPTGAGTERPRAGSDQAARAGD
ncbi:MAG: hypothetical protein WKH47_06255 [Actinomycetes bacterium]